MFTLWKIWLALFFWNTSFEIRPVDLLPTYYVIQLQCFFSEVIYVNGIWFYIFFIIIIWLIISWSNKIFDFTPHFFIPFQLVFAFMSTTYFHYFLPLLLIRYKDLHYLVSYIQHSKYEHFCIIFCLSRCYLDQDFWYWFLLSLH